MNEDKKPDRAGAPDRPGLKLRLENKLGLLGELRLVAYRGHGTASSLHVKGRLIEAKGESGNVEKDSGLLSTVLTTLRRIDSDEIPGARLRARFGEQETDIYTDQEGFFQLNLYLDDSLDEGWHEVELELVESVRDGARTDATARVYVPSPAAEFAIVSDLDDTVIKSQATDKLAQVRLTLFRDAASRTPFKGVAALYRALIAGSDGKGKNPVFYVSRSGWNLYDLFTEFLEVHGIPEGPLFLQDLAFREKKSRALGAEHHKLACIRNLLKLYPRLPFVLIGDSGQGDAKRYRQIAMENPGRIRAVYLRDVSDSERRREIESIAESLRHRGVPTTLAEDSSAFAAHMEAEGLISGV